jgi:hypothetical protein
MKNHSRIRFNPVTKEIEIKGSESFVKTYFDKIQAMISGPSQKTVAAKKEPKAVKAAKAKKAEKKVKVKKASSATKAKKEPKAAKPSPQKKAKKAAKRAPGVKRITKIDTVVRFIRGSAEGISTSELKEKTGFSELQIWGIVNRASKEGKIRNVKRGVYGGVAETQEQKTI